MYVSFLSVFALVGVVESPVVVIVGGTDIRGVVGSGVVAIVDFWHVVGSHFFPVLEQNVNTVVVPSPMGHPVSIGVDLIAKLIDPVVLGVLIALNSKDIMVEAVELRADIHHWKRIAVEMNVPGVLRESKARADREETDGAVPGNQRVRGILLEVSPDGFEIEFPLIAC